MSPARIALINPACVDASALSDIAETAALPLGHVLLLVGDSKLPPLFQAFCLPRILVPQAADVFGLEDYLDRDWDCGVVVGMTWAKRQPDYPAYFAYLLGHEFGHATTALNNPGLAIYEDLIAASCDKIRPGHKWRWDELPHETIYDEFGLAISVDLFGSQQVEEEFDKIIALGLSGDVPRLESLLDRGPNRDLSRVHDALAAFSNPAKDVLVEFWISMRASGRLKQAEGLGDFRAFWGAS
jgi:hypothetical protein